MCNIDLQNKAILAARSYLGVPYFHTGRSRLGLDCGGLLVMVSRDCGFRHHDLPSSYSRRPNPRFQQLLDRQMLVLGPDDPIEPADWYLFWMEERGVGQHVAMRTDRGIIHANEQAGRVIETELPGHYERQIVARYRVKELAAIG